MSRCCRAGAAVVLVGAACVPLAQPAGGQQGLQLDPAAGPAGLAVDAEHHGLPDWCLVYELRWGGLFGASLGTDDATDGSAVLTFRVPGQAPPGDHQVSGGCRQPTGGAIPVGQATFEVTRPPTSSTTGTVPGATTTTTTTRPPATSTSTSTSTSRPTISVPATGPVPTTVAPSSTTSSPGTRTTTTTRTAGEIVPPPVPTTLEECEDQARQAAAQLVYEPERRMTVGGTYDVVAALALTRQDLELADPIPSSSSPTTMVLVKGARCTVEAELTGGAFDVSPDGPRAQSFVDTRVLTWQWQVTPRRTGAGHKLVLRLQSKIHEQGGESRNGRDVFHESVINVTTEPVSPLDRFGRMINDTAGNEVVRYLLLPGGSGVLATWAWRAIRRRREDSAQGGGAGVGAGVARQRDGWGGPGHHLG